MDRWSPIERVVRMADIDTTSHPPNYVSTHILTHGQSGIFVSKKLPGRPGRLWTPGMQVWELGRWFSFAMEPFNNFFLLIHNPRIQTVQDVLAA